MVRRQGSTGQTCNQVINVRGIARVEKAFLVSLVRLPALLPRTISLFKFSLELGDTAGTLTRLTRIE
jgi:hypothetical protein